MRKWRFYRSVFLLPALLLTGCGFESAGMRVGVLVLIPFLLLLGVLWLLHRRPSRDDEEDWEAERFPDSDDDDDNENHYLM
ncbi:MAG: hypothetical protein R6X15_01620 [Pseudomonadota bacterium]